MEQVNTLLVATLTVGLFGLIVGLASGYNLGLHKIGTPPMGSHMMSTGVIMKDGMNM